MRAEYKRNKLKELNKINNNDIIFKTTYNIHIENSKYTIEIKKITKLQVFLPTLEH
jgi:hypothetical protein